MMESPSLRRFAAYAGIVLAAVASVATSKSAEPVDLQGHDTLSAAAPEISHHFTVTSEARHDVTLTANIDWKGVVDASPADVLVRVTADDTSASSALSAHAATAKGISTVTPNRLSTACTDDPCTRGYTVVITLFEAGPSDRVAIDWTFSARGENGGEEPTVTED